MWHIIFITIIIRGQDTYLYSVQEIGPFVCFQTFLLIWPIIESMIIIIITFQSKLTPSNFDSRNGNITFIGTVVLHIDWAEGFDYFIVTTFDVSFQCHESNCVHGSRLHVSMIIQYLLLLLC